MVLYDLERQQTIPLPDEWRKAITDYEGLENSVQ
jgi:acyl-CoA thioester hydrolase